MCFKKKQPLNLIILGGQGSGKGSQSEFISKRYNIPHISTGDLLRDNISRQTKDGLEAQTYMNKGVLVPDAIVTRLLKQRLKEKDAKNGFLLDGYPRTEAQSNELDKITDISAVINLEALDDVLIDRLLGRRSCNKCKKIYNIRTLKNTNKCEVCGSELITRADDTQEAILKRLNEFRLQSEPLFKKYAKQKNVKGQSKVLNIDATKTIPEVDDEITRKLTEFLK